MNELVVSFLLSLSQILGVGDLPVDDLGHWKVVSSWSNYGDGARAEFSSQTIAQDCQTNPDLGLVFPKIIHGQHRIFADGRLIFDNHTPKFAQATSFYYAPTISCRELQGVSGIRWVTFSYSKYFARVSAYPYVGSDLWGTFFTRHANLLAAGMLLMMGLLSTVIFYGRIPFMFYLSLSLSSVFFAGFFLLSVSDLLNLKVSMLTAHKAADLSLFLGGTCLVMSYAFHSLITMFSLRLLCVCMAIGASVILFAGSGDMVQFGTNLNIFPIAVLFFWTFVRQVTRLRDGNALYHAFGAINVFCILIPTLNETLIVTGLFESYNVISFGTVGTMFFLIFSVNTFIQEAYEERDYLRGNLEQEVESQTKQIREQKDQIERNHIALQEAQAELIQKEKLASLGTLSAGIAHEINNSLNFVKGAIAPLKKQVFKNQVENREKIDSLFEVIDDGLVLTFKIMDSLRNYTALNQASLKKVSVESLLDSVLVMLRSRYKGRIRVQVDLEDKLELTCHTVGISQVLMNLMGNAMDALEESSKADKTIIISGKFEGSQVCIQITDNANGMIDTVKSKLFDPFFTTKEVGKGTGLGMYIVKKEVDRHNGKIEVDSEQGKGTTFTLRFPRELNVSTNDELRSAS